MSLYRVQLNLKTHSRFWKMMERWIPWEVSTSILYCTKIICFENALSFLGSDGTINTFFEMCPLSFCNVFLSCSTYFENALSLLEVSTPTLYCATIIHFAISFLEITIFGGNNGLSSQQASCATINALKKRTFYEEEICGCFQTYSL